MSKHYIAMSGMHGCLPDHCDVFESVEDATSDLVQLFQLGRIRENILRENLYLELKLTPIEENQGVEFGADYCEIQTCTCDDPSVHSDSGDLDQFSHRGHGGFCAKCGGECEYDSDGNKKEK